MASSSAAQGQKPAVGPLRNSPAPVIARAKPVAGTPRFILRTRIANCSRVTASGGATWWWRPGTSDGSVKAQALRACCGVVVPSGSQPA